MRFLCKSATLPKSLEEPEEEPEEGPSQPSSHLHSQGSSKRIPPVISQGSSKMIPPVISQGSSKMIPPAISQGTSNKKSKPPSSQLHSQGSSKINSQALSQETSNGNSMIYVLDDELLEFVAEDETVDVPADNPIEILEDANPEAVSNVRWTFDDEVILIDFYHDNPVLWNPRLEEYKSAAKSSLIDDIGILLDKKFSRK